MQSLSPKDRRQLRTRQAILDAARTLIRTQGPDGLSMRAIASLTDYSPAGLYEYFAGKDEIIREVCRQGGDLLYAYMARTEPSLPVLDRLRAAGMAYVRFAREQPDYFLMMFTSSASPLTGPESPEPRESGPAYGLLVQLIQEGIQEGVLHPRPGFGLPEMTYAAWVTVHGIAMLEAGLLRNDSRSTAAFHEAALENLLAGFQSRLGSQEE